jgi:phosphatidylglycerophosphate synthase
VSTRSPKPSIAELRAVGQPASIFARNSGEHWAGRLYVRRVSPYVTRVLLRTPLSANAVTWLMIAVGVAAAALLAIDQTWTAIAAVVLIQGQILLDCCDGEIARWRETYSPLGIYLDRLGHYSTETLFPIALGIRCDKVTLGLVAALLVLTVRVESALVAVARLESGLGKGEDTAEAAAPTVAPLAVLKRSVALFPLFRMFVAVEASVVALVFVLLDEVDALVTAMVPIAGLTAAGRLLAIITSARLR